MKIILILGLAAAFICYCCLWVSGECSRREEEDGKDDC